MTTSAAAGSLVPAAREKQPPGVTRTGRQLAAVRSPITDSRGGVTPEWRSSLRAAYPSAELVLLGAPWHARWLANRPSPVTRVLVVPPAPGIRLAEPDETLPAREEFLARARAEKFDLAVQLHGGGRNSNPLVSALGARGRDGTFRAYDICENSHANHILSRTEAPATIQPATARRAADIAECIADALDYVGMIAVEMFVVDGASGEELIVNEIAPRVHNSGHWTIDGAASDCTARSAVAPSARRIPISRVRSATDVATRP